MTHSLFALLLALQLFGAAEIDDPPEGDEVAYTLQDRWDEQWLRIFDRTGRPDPDGPILQRFDADLYRRYHLDIHVADFPLATEPGWATQREGVRMWVQSLSELELANRLQIRTEAPTWEGGYVFFAYDRRQDRLTDRHVFRFDVGHRDIAGTGLDGAIRFHPRWVKNDVDVELMLRYPIESAGVIGARLSALDPFINASFGLLEARGVMLEEHVRHMDLPLAAILEFQSQSFFGVRGEAYGGVVLPQTRRHRFRDEPQGDHLRGRQALLGAALLEWNVPALPLSIGGALETVDARMSWDFEQTAEVDREIRELTLSTRLYAMSQPRPDLHIEAFALRTIRPQWETGPGTDNIERSDSEWLLSLRSFWMITDIVGADLGLLRLQRTTEGPPNLGVDGQFNRIVTRLILEFNDKIWTTFGVGWSFDADTYVYDGGGMTLTYTP